jgi:hypothetical protein
MINLTVLPPSPKERAGVRPNKKSPLVRYKTAFNILTKVLPGIIYLKLHP